MLLLFIEDIFLNLVARQIGSVSLDSIERSITGSGDSARLNWSDYDEPGNKYTSGDIEHPLNLIYASYAAFLHLASGTLIDLRLAFLRHQAKILEIPSSTSSFMALCCLVFSHGLILGQLSLVDSSIPRDSEYEWISCRPAS